MSAKEVLKMLNISRATLTNYVKRELIKVKARPFGRYDYEEESVRRLLDENYQSLNEKEYE